MLNMFEAIVLGAIQGIAEWLPVSSEGAIILAQVHLFGESSLSSALDIALFLHLGTLAAACVYFCKDIKELLSYLLKFESAPFRTQRTLSFLVVSSILSAVLGFFILRGVRSLESFFSITGTGISLVIGCALLLTAILLYTRRIGFKTKTEDDLTVIDSLLLGVGQGLALIPGLSRSGTTVSLLLLRQFKEELSLKLSFLISIPIVAGGILLLLFEGFVVNTYAVVALISSFVFGLVTIGVLMRIARKINFAHFVLAFAILTFLSVFV